MRKSAEQKAAAELAAQIITGTLSCIGAIALALTVFGAIAAKIDLSDGAMSVMSGLALSAGCFAASYTVAKRRRKNGLITGFVCGGAVFAAVLLGGIIFVRSFSAGGFISKLLIILSCSGIGGIIGVNSHKRFR